MNIQKISTPRTARKCSLCNEDTALFVIDGHDYCELCRDHVISIASMLRYDPTEGLQQDEIAAGSQAIFG